MDARADERGREVRPRLLTRAALATSLLALAVVPSADASATPTTGRLLVLLEHPADAGPVAQAAAARGVVARAGARSAGHSAPRIGLVTVRPRAGESLRALAGRLRADPGVHSVQAERRFSLRRVPNDPALTLAEPATGAPPGTPIEWWAQRQGLPAAWDIVTGESATVAIIDTGIDAAHPEFAGRIRDTVDLDSDPTDGPATTDQAGHGTHVASLACANADNAVGIAGAGFNCSLLIIKTDLSDSSVAQGIITAADRGADALNMSFGTDGTSPPSDAVVRAIDYAYQHKVVMVAAAADQPVEEQGDPSNVLQPTGTGGDLTKGKGLSVTAANFADQRAGFAGRGSQISLAAYGAFGVPNGPRGILGAFPSGITQLETGAPPIPPGDPGEPACNCRTTFEGDNRYAYIQGTSMSAPMVTAVAALMRHVNPQLGGADVIRLMKMTARRPAGTGWGPELGWGILDAGAALQAARRVDRTAPVSQLRAPALVHGRSFTLRWTGTDPSPPGLEPSGIARYEVWRVANGRPVRRIAVTTATTLRVAARLGSRYAFFTVAVDRAGNREGSPATPDARTRVVSSR